MADSDLSKDILSPRRSAMLFGHQAVEQTLLHALDQERMHHAWLLHGPAGIGKATLAYRLARYLFAGNEGSSGEGTPSLIGPDTGAETDSNGLAVPPEHRIFRQVAAGGHADLCVLTAEDPEKGRQEIRVNDVRRTIGFFGLTSARDGWRISIIDGADRLNINAANALLKMLEEPPPGALFILTADTPSRLPATLRSRCRKLALRPLERSDFDQACRQGAPDQDVAGLDLDALYKLSEGSPGRALRYALGGDLETRSAALAIFERLPAWDSQAVHALAERAGGANGRRVLAILRETTSAWISGRVAALAESGRSPAALEDWAGLWEKLEGSFSDAERVHLDGAHIALDAFLAIEKTTAKPARRTA